MDSSVCFVLVSWWPTTTIFLTNVVREAVWEGGTVKDRVT